MGKIALRDSFPIGSRYAGRRENIVAFARRSPINRFDGFSTRVNSLENLDKAGAVTSNPKELHRQRLKLVLHFVFVELLLHNLKYINLNQDQPYFVTLFVCRLFRYLLR